MTKGWICTSKNQSLYASGCKETPEQSEGEALRCDLTVVLQNALPLSYILVWTDCSGHPGQGVMSKGKTEWLKFKSYSSDAQQRGQWGQTTPGLTQGGNLLREGVRHAAVKSPSFWKRLKILESFWLPEWSWERLSFIMFPSAGDWCQGLPIPRIGPDAETTSPVTKYSL